MSDIRIGFIGLGNMGGLMAKSLAANGFTLTVYDLVKEAVEDLESVGATAAKSSREAAAASDIIFSMVRDIPQTDEVIFGKDGVWQGISEGKTIIISSSIGPAYCRKLYEKAKERGVRVIDCGVSDPTVFRHEPGALTLMIGGDEDAVRRCWPVFEAMGKKIFYLGKIGNGQAYKLINNMAAKHIGAVDRLCLIECLNLGLKVGLDLQKMIDVMSVSAGARLLQNMGFKAGLDEKQILGALRIPVARASGEGVHHKDELDYGMEMADAAGVDRVVTKDDLAILDEFKFEIQPVGIKYLTKKPADIRLIDESTTLCAMLRKAQEGDCFYAGPENHTCEAGPYVMGQTEIKEQFINGEWGAGLRVFCDPRAASRLYHYIPRITPDVNRYIAMAPLSKLSFDPDVLIIFANTRQAEIMLSAMSYKTGQMWMSRYSSAIGCAWMFVYPYLSGEINYGISGLGFGMRRRKLFPENYQWLSIPFIALPTFLQTLKEMPWVPAPYKPDGFEYVDKLKVRLGLN